MSELPTTKPRPTWRARLVYDCPSCAGVFAEHTVEAVLKRAAANRHGSAITPELERIASPEGG